MKNIRRVEVGNTRGWQIHIQREGEEYTKLFSDRVWGGRDEALEAAKRHRDRLYTIMSGPIESAEHLHREEVREKAWRKLTSTGVKGVGFTMQESRGTEYPFIQTMWTENGERRSCKRSITKHGLDSALWQCCVALYEGRDEQGPSPEELYEEAHPAIKALVAERTRDTD